MAQDALDVRQEPHVEHAVRLVEDEHLEAGESGVGRLHVVEQPARRGDHDVHAAPKRVLLRAHADAAVDGGRRDRGVHGEIVHVLEDLGGEFTRGAQHEGAGGAALGGEQPVQDGEDEGGGLAAAGHGAGQKIATLEGRRDGIGLDRCGAGKPEFLDALEEAGMEVQS